MSRQIAVLNNLSNEDTREQIWQECNRDRWLFGHSSGGDSGVSFWKMDLDDSETVSHFWQVAKPQCDKLAGGDLKVIRQYANGHTYGLGGQPHKDDTREGCFTLLYYPMPNWQDTWDGETVYYHDNGEIRCAIKPKPNRGVFFDSKITHVGRPPSRYFGGLRVTIAFKLELSN